MYQYHKNIIVPGFEKIFYQLCRLQIVKRMNLRAQNSLPSRVGLYGTRYFKF